MGKVKRDFFPEMDAIFKCCQPVLHLKTYFRTMGWREMGREGTSPRGKKKG